MLSYQDKIKVSNILDETLGTGTNLKTDERVFHCPFCNHHKKKLNINLVTQKYHCWVCDAKGQSIYFLLKKLQVGKPTLTFINKVYESEYYVPSSKEKEEQPIYLPKEFRSLTEKPSGFNPSYARAKSYLDKRGISYEDIIKHNIGFCSHGTYAGRIIVPSYDPNGKLNYFIARSFYEDEKYKYKNPTVSRDIVALGNQINWNEPLVIVEGVFDAITVKRNVIPIFGKVIPKKTMKEIFMREVSKIYIMLDEDAQKQALYYVDYFSKQGIECINIQPSDKDANQMGFAGVLEVLKQTKKTNFGDMISQKLKI